MKRDAVIIYLLSCIALVGALLLLFLDPIPQDSEYHNFADHLTHFSLPNFYNVITNIPFFITAFLGFNIVIRNKPNEISRHDTVVIGTLFLGVFLTALGSAYYHYEPNNSTLVWDRLPMTLVFTSLFSILVQDYVKEELGRILFYLFVPMGIFSVWYWWYTDTTYTSMYRFEGGDLRFYVFVQFYPIVSIPIILWLSKNRKGISILTKVIACYVLAKLFEYFDYFLFESIGYSGHSIKHLFAAWATYFIYIYFKQRQFVTTVDQVN